MKFEILIETVKENEIPIVNTFDDLQKAEIYYRNKSSEEKNNPCGTKITAKLINRNNDE